jgi:D-lactate dehydrogenase
VHIAVFSTQPYDARFLERANGGVHDLAFFEARLAPDTVRLAAGADAVCAFVNDDLGAKVLQKLADRGVRLVALRCAGFNHVDLEAAARLGIAVGRVPAYSPHAVAEHTLALILALNRKLHRAYNRVREGNFALDGLLGFDLAGKTAGVVGTGQIGRAVARILRGFDCTVLAHDPQPDAGLQAMGVSYVEMAELLAASDVITLHCPLTPASHHLIDEAALERIKPGVMLVNTSRGALIDTRAAIRGLKTGRIGSLGLDVYEEEADLFFRDLSGRIIPDDVFARLLTFPNVLITGHQAFFTEEALQAIAEASIANATAFERDGRVVHPVHLDAVVPSR